jgi:FlaA1/EpsC-like NDP-sugar epimerase
MNKLQQIIKSLTHFSLHAQIKLNGKSLSPLVTFAILVIGVVSLARLLTRRLLIPMLYPLLRKLFLHLIRRKSKLLSKQTNEKWVLINGACTKVGKFTAKILAARNYSLILVDQNLSKLQKLESDLHSVFPKLAGIRIAQIDFATQRDSTAIEHQLHRALFKRDPWSDVPEDPQLEVELEINQDS